MFMIEVLSCLFLFPTLKPPQTTVLQVNAITSEICEIHQVWALIHHIHSPTKTEELVRMIYLSEDVIHTNLRW